LSDLHPHCLDGVMARAARLVGGLTVDLAVVTGDFQEQGRPSAHDTARDVLPLLNAYRASHGTFAILGNHDSHDMADALAAHGVAVLINEHAVIERDGERLVLVGTDDVVRFFTEAAVTALTHRPEGFSVALVHSAELADVAAQAGIRLYLSGHTHGGQICLPGGTPVVTASDAPRCMAAGSWRVGAMHGHTSRGVGVGLPPLRYNCPGEIVRITLRRR
ncbi:MAG TPA: metallophosphoesterase, partial [Candidatus Omnitrophota bacterium]|nr:metallophosphoesterase [Candidatus Omnitrophota bacterium]